MPEGDLFTVIVLAAGGSRRMGRPKQLLPVGDQPLLRRVVERLLGPPVARIILVLGAKAPAVRHAVAGMPVHVVINPQWSEGLGSSVRLGLEALLAIDAGASGVVLALGDQPNFSRAHVGQLLAARASAQRPIVASRCGGALMPPAFFAAEYFPELLALTGDAGARALFARHAGVIAEVPAEDLADLDTPEDYAAFLARSSHPGPSG